MKRLSIAAALASMSLLFAPAPTLAINPRQDATLEHFIPKPSKKKNNFPRAKTYRYRRTKTYRNPRGAYVTNPKIAADMNARHDAWYFKKFGVMPGAY